MKGNQEVNGSQKHEETMEISTANSEQTGIRSEALECGRNEMKKRRRREQKRMKRPLPLHSAAKPKQ